MSYRLAEQSREGMGRTTLLHSRVAVFNQSYKLRLEFIAMFLVVRAVHQASGGYTEPGYMRQNGNRRAASESACALICGRTHLRY